MKEEEIKNQIAEILRTDIYYSTQLNTFVIHGAIEAIWKLMQEYASKPVTIPYWLDGIHGQPTDEQKQHLQTNAAQSAPKQSAGVLDNVISILQENYEAAKRMDAPNGQVRAIIEKEILIETYEDLIAIFKNKKDKLDEGQQLQSQQQNLFQKKDVTLHSGEVSDFKIDCDALTDADLDCLAYLVSKKIDFSRVVSVPKGGDRFANALRKYRNYKQPPKGERSIIILCDDVLTSGKSMEEKRQELISIDGTPKDKIKGVVIFARGKCPDWITPIFSLQSQQQSNIAMQGDFSKEQVYPIPPQQQEEEVTHEKFFGENIGRIRNAVKHSGMTTTITDTSTSQQQEDTGIVDQYDILKNQIEDYKHILLNFTDCPQVIVDNPALLRNKKATDKDIAWAQKAITEFEQEDKVIEEVKEYMNDLDNYFKKEEDKKVLSISEVEGHKINDSEDKIGKAILWCEKREKGLVHALSDYGEGGRDMIKEMKTFLQSL